MELLPPASCCRLHRAFMGNKVPGKWGFSPRRNKDQHLVYVVGGQGYYLLEEGEGLRRLDFTPGTVIYVPSGVLHGGYLAHETDRPRIIPLRFGFYPHGKRGFWDLSEMSDQLDCVWDTPVVCHPRMTAWWRDNFEQVYHIHKEDKNLSGSEEACGVLIESLLRRMILLGGNSEPSVRAEKLLRVKRMMDEGSDNVTLALFAAEAGMSEKYFQKKFREEFGLTPMEYHRRRIMERSLNLLQDTRMSVDEIGRYLGYADGFSFSRAFKRHFGQSPRSFRLN